MIIFLYGEDQFRIYSKLAELKNKFIKEIDPTGSNLLVLDGEKAKLEEINEAIAPAALFFKKRMVVIENIFANKTQDIHAGLAARLEKIDAGSESNILVFRDAAVDEKKTSSSKAELFKLLKKQKYSHCYKSLNTAETVKWARDKIAAAGMRIKHDALDQLVSITGNDLWRLSNELDKLFSFKMSAAPARDGEIKIIGLEDIGSAVNGKIETGIFALTDALGNNDRRLAAALLDSQLNSGASDNYLLAMIIRQFKILLQIKVALSQGMSSRKITGYLKLHPYVVQKCLMQVKKYDESLLRGIIGKLLDAEYKMKSGMAETRLELSLLIAEI